MLPEAFGFSESYRNVHVQRAPGICDRIWWYTPSYKSLMIAWDKLDMSVTLNILWSLGSGWTCRPPWDNRLSL